MQRLVLFLFSALDHRDDIPAPMAAQPRGRLHCLPQGEHLKDRVATIRVDQTSSVPWQWWISYDLAKGADHAKTRQAAADAATAAWPEMKAEAARLAQIAAEAEALRTMVQRVMSTGDLSVSLFAIETSSSDRLRNIIAIAKEAGGLGGPGKPLVEACSAELFRRRVKRC